MCAIETEGLAKSFGRHQAVAGISLSVPEGSVYGFLGANGAGKTTTIRMILGLVRPDAGSARIFGHDVMRERAVAARSIGALLEARAIYDHLSGRDNLDISRRLLRLPASEVDRVLELTDMRRAAKRRVGHYSLGMRQRLGLARAMLGSPRLLVLDEPMNGLDPDGIADMRRTIRALPEQSGVTVFLSSHLLSEVQQTATHIGLMREGRLVLQGGMESLLKLSNADLFVRAAPAERARKAIVAAGLSARAEADGLLIAGGASKAPRIASALIEAGASVHELSPRPDDLESLYRRMQEAA